jgi:hypothetical protein
MHHLALEYFGAFLEWELRNLRYISILSSANDKKFERVPLKGSKIRIISKEY